MKLAIQENIVPGKTLSEKIWKIEEYGFDGIEVWGSGLPQRLNEIKNALSTTKIKLSTVCSGYDGDLLRADRKSREIAIRDIKERLGICAELRKVGVIIVPTFGGPKISDLYSWRFHVRDVERIILVEELKVLGEYADDVGAYILLEPLNHCETHLIDRLEQAVEVYRVVGKEHVKIMADFFHMNIEGADIARSIEAANGYITHIHLAGSNRLPPGYGHIDFKSGFNALRKIGYRNFMALKEYWGTRMPNCLGA